MIWLGIMLFACSLLFLFGAERSRRDIEVCKNWFMTKNGGSSSMFGYLYLGRPQVARDEIAQNATLRRRFLIELYVKSLLLFILAIVAFIYA